MESFYNDRTIESKHPPLRSLTIDHGEPPVLIKTSPYKIHKPNDPKTNLSSILSNKTISVILTYIQ